MKSIFSILLVFCLVQFGSFLEEDDFKQFNKTGPSKNAFSSRGIFNVIQFPNTACAASNSRNGTCYTSDECSARHGTGTGTCANGYGVCCVFTLLCGQTTRENCTYLVLGGTSTPPSSCTYTICKCNANICRIRLDFNVFDINPPFVGTAVAGTVAAGFAPTGGAIGDCIIDSFAVSAPGNKGSPTICGFNTGQHMYIDMSDLCSVASFIFGGSTYVRQYDIKVTQFACNDQLTSGPPDCLQYLTANMGTIMSFNFQTVGSAVIAQTTHLSSQCYDICFRRNAQMCALCFSTTINPNIATVINQNSFGLSVTNVIAGIAAARGLQDTFCSSDYLQIPIGVITEAAALAGIGNGATSSRFCGRFLTTVIGAGATASSTVCTGLRPFRITFKTTPDEVTNFPVGAIIVSGDQDETSLFPSGIIGFQLDYWQVPCTGGTVG